MAVKQATPPRGNGVSVHGLEHGRKLARRRAARRRLKNNVVSGVVFLLAAGAVGTAGYYVWQFYGDEQDRIVPSERPVVQRDAEDLIEQLEDQPRWNGPGAPAFGVGDDEQP